jgi:hypothetical protein
MLFIRFVGLEYGRTEILRHDVAAVRLWSENPT